MSNFMHSTPEPEPEPEPGLTTVAADTLVSYAEYPMVNVAFARSIQMSIEVNGQMVHINGRLVSRNNSNYYDELIGRYTIKFDGTGVEWLFYDYMKAYVILGLIKDGHRSQIPVELVEGMIVTIKENLYDCVKFVLQEEGPAKHNEVTQRVINGMGDAADGLPTYLGYAINEALWETCDKGDVVSYLGDDVLTDMHGNDLQEILYKLKGHVPPVVTDEDGRELRHIDMEN